LRLSEILPVFSILYNDKPVYSGRAIVIGLVNTGSVCLCEVELEGVWQDAAALASAPPEELKSAFKQFLQTWQTIYKIDPEFKAAVADMHAFLTEARLWLEQLELGIRSVPAGDRVKMEQDMAAASSEVVIPMLTSLFDRFESAGGKIDEEHRTAHRHFAQKQLHPIVLCSPFLYRCFRKPLGYAGDYEMVNMMMRDPYEGSSLFAKVVNAWFLSQPPVQAHRNRIKYLQERILDVVLRTKSRGRPARILSLGCGPAHEVQAFLSKKEFSGQATFTLIDFDQETLEHVSATLAELQSQFGRTASVEVIKKSVNQLLKDAARSVSRSPEQQYDLIYCAGLYDYLTDAICKRVSSLLYDWLGPGGLVIATNVDPSNPRQLTMEMMAEWHLVSRDGAQMNALKPDRAANEHCVVKSDLTGVNIYLHASKPE
jgi:extracellular factor (EF) 3-hydroxypalmitic acid methyl ester biosynthesis protein